MHTAPSSHSSRTSALRTNANRLALAALALAGAAVACPAASAAEEVLPTEARIIRCSPVPAPSVVETWQQAIESGTNFGSMYSMSGATYGDACESQYAMELTEIPAGATFYKTFGGGDYAIPATASSVCATMSWSFEMWGLNAGGWTLMGEQSGNGEYVALSATEGQCGMGGSIINQTPHALDGYSAIIVSTHVQQLSGNLIPVELGIVYPGTP